MRVIKARLFIVISILVTLAGCAGAPEQALDLPPAHDQLLQELRAGGVGILLVHTVTDLRQQDTDHVNLQDCSRQRNLNDKGREDAKMIGEAIRKLGLTVGNVYSSPYCRCLDTARLAFDRADSEPNLRTLIRSSDIEVQRRTRWLKDGVAAVPPGRIDVWVSHADLFTEVSHLNLKDGQAAVIKPGARGGFRVISVLTPEQWRSLAEVSQ